jgi:non-ribosomal peptide synthetase component F
LTRRHQATLFMVFVAAWTWTLSRFASQDDVVVGTSIANRVRPEIFGVIGLFTNNLALRVDFRGVWRFADALRLTKKTVLDAYERQDMPFQLVVEALAPRRPPGRRPFFDVTIVENRAAPWPGLASCQTDAFGAPQAIAKYDLALEFSATAGEIRGKVTYATPLYGAHTVERLVQCLVGLLQRAAGDDNASVHDVPIA